MGEMDSGDRDRFGQLVAERIRTKAPHAEVVYEPEQFRITITERGEREGGKQVGVVNLANSYRGYTSLTGDVDGDGDGDGDEADADSLAADREALIERLARAVTTDDAPTTWEDVRPKLFPVIRRADFNLGPPEAPALAAVSRPFAPCLSEFVVIDLPERIGYVMVKELAAWEVSADEAFAVAHANLADHFRSLLERRDAKGPTATAFVGVGFSYNGSLPLLDGWLAAWSAGWGARRPVFVVTQQNDLLVAPEPDTYESLAGMLANAEQEWLEAPRAISPVIYTIDDAGKAVPYDVPADRPHDPDQPGEAVDAADATRTALRRSWALLATGVYAGQTAYLRAEAELGGPFAAALQRFTRPADDTTFTLATWGEGDLVLLPEADWVAFAGDGDQFFVRWDDVLRECALVPEPGYHPTRYLASGWPEPEVMTRLRALAGRP